MSNVVQILVTTFSAFIFLLIFAIPFLLKWLFFDAGTSKKNPPPSPPRLPIIGHLHKLGSHPHRSFLSLARRHGPIMLLRLGNKEAVIVSSADAAREIMKTHDLVFSDRPDFKINRKLLYDLKDISVAPYGKYWQRMKSLCVLLFLSNKMVQSFRAIREEETALMMARIEEESRSTSPGILNLSEMFAEIANHVVCRSTIGRKYAEGESGKKFRRSLWELAGLLGNANVGDFLPWLGWINWVNGRDALVERVAKELDEFLEVVVEEHMDRLGRHERKNGSVEGVKGDDERREDFVDILIKIYKEDEAGDGGVSIDRNSIKALMLVRSLSFSISLSISLYLLLFLCA
ncbi:unspecific monooxygenase [Sarracenia purpurea var. burkii]